MKISKDFFLLQIDPKVAFPRRAHPKVRSGEIYDVHLEVANILSPCSSPSQGRYLNFSRAELDNVQISRHICLCWHNSTCNCKSAPKVSRVFPPEYKASRCARVLQYFYSEIGFYSDSHSDVQLENFDFTPSITASATGYGYCSDRKFNLSFSRQIKQN